MEKWPELGLNSGTSDPEPKTQPLHHTYIQTQIHTYIRTYTYKRLSEIPPPEATNHHDCHKCFCRQAVVIAYGMLV